jgi:hypothetical protein
LAAARAPIALFLSLLLHGVVALTLVFGNLVPQPAGLMSVPPVDSWSGSTFDVEAVLAQSQTTRLGEPASALGRGTSPESPIAGSNATQPLARTRADPGALTFRSRQSGRESRRGVRKTDPHGRERSPSGAGSTTPLGAATFGANGGEDGIRVLARAFVRAVPPATSLDPIWRSLPAGDAGTLRVELVVMSGSIETVRGLEQGPLALRRLVERTVRMIERGRFQVGLRGTDSGTEVLIITVRILDRGLGEDRTDESDAVMELGSEGPTVGHPGRAFFTLASGRHVEIRVRRSPEDPASR